MSLIAFHGFGDWRNQPTRNCSCVQSLGPRFLPARGVYWNECGTRMVIWVVGVGVERNLQAASTLCDELHPLRRVDRLT